MINRPKFKRSLGSVQSRTAIPPRELAMTTIAPRNRTTLDASTAATIDQIQAKLGSVPNLFLTFAHSPVALNAYVQLADVAGSGALNARQREQISLIVAQRNQCDYCLAAHTAIGGMVGLKPAQIEQARRGLSDDAKTNAALVLAAQIVNQRGHVTAAEVAAFKASGFDDGAVLEVLVNVVLNIYTNYTNHIAGTEVDFPLVLPLAA
jgi:uncharacterized peroxidase-related enzyme